MTGDDVTLVIPTYDRGALLLATLRHLAGQSARPAEIIVVDQTEAHSADVARALREAEAGGAIRRLVLTPPSIPAAMNRALREARTPLVLFIDDDVEPSPDLVRAHALAYTDASTWAVAGQVLQPGQQPVDAGWRGVTRGMRAYLDFPFHGARRAWIGNAMAGNLSVRRDRAIACGGFDENFVGSAYRFETEFARRLTRAGGRILFEPAAGVRHLRAARGGTRTRGDHRCSASPLHGVGDYYLAMRSDDRPAALLYMLARPYREIASRFHLARPWWIPVKLLGEWRAFRLARRLARQKPRLLDAARDDGAPTAS